MVLKNVSLELYNDASERITKFRGNSRITKIYTEANCAICLDEKPVIGFRHCGHVLVCKECWATMKDTLETDCPLCRKRPFSSDVHDLTKLISNIECLERYIYQTHPLNYFSFCWSALSLVDEFDKVNPDRIAERAQKLHATKSRFRRSIEACQRFGDHLIGIEQFWYQLHDESQYDTVENLESSSASICLLFFAIVMYVFEECFGCTKTKQKAAKLDEKRLALKEELNVLGKSFQDILLESDDVLSLHKRIKGDGTFKICPVWEEMFTRVPVCPNLDTVDPEIFESEEKLKFWVSINFPYAWYEDILARNHETLKTTDVAKYSAELLKKFVYEL